jgi:FtsP/CotA-like multicopper oxidase with cupredoxin domain
MTRAHRFTFLGIAVVIAVVAVIFIGGGEDEATETADTPPTVTPTPDDADATATATATPTPEPPPVLQGGKLTKLRYREGETVRFRVTSDAPEEVHIHGYDIAKEIAAGETVTVTFKADLTGIFEIEYENAHEQIGQLRVDPN